MAIYTLSNQLLSPQVPFEHGRRVCDVVLRSGFRRLRDAQTRGLQRFVPGNATRCRLQEGQGFSDRLKPGRHARSVTCEQECLIKPSIVIPRHIRVPAFLAPTPRLRQSKNHLRNSPLPKADLPAPRARTVHEGFLSDRKSLARHAAAVR